MNKNHVEKHWLRLHFLGETKLWSKFRSHNKSWFPELTWCTNSSISQTDNIYIIKDAFEAIIKWNHASIFLPKVHHCPCGVIPESPSQRAAVTSNQLPGLHCLIALLSALKQQPLWQLRGANLWEGEEHCTTFPIRRGFPSHANRLLTGCKKGLQWQQPSKETTITPPWTRQWDSPLPLWSPPSLSTNNTLSYHK